MNQIFFFLILSTLTSTGYLTTTCRTCWSIDSTCCCEEKEKKCDGPKCMTLSEYCNISGKIYNTVKKNCAFEPMCEACFSLTTVSGFLTRVSGQCGVGNCSNAHLNFKETCPDPLPDNGLKCPSCYDNTTTNGCESKVYVPCGGRERECVDVRAVIEISDGSVVPMSIQGCVTEGGCGLGFGPIPGAKVLQMGSMTCTAAQPI